jgi:3-hydroxy-3-methylglutaryl CoA synthase
LENHLKKVTIGVDAACFASDNSGSETNGRGAVAIFVPINLSSVICHNHVSFSEEVVL